MDKKESLPAAEKNEIIVYQPEGGEFHIEVRVENETVWLKQAQMAELFSTSRTNIVEHISHIYEENELDQGSTCRKFRQVQIEGSRRVSRQIPFYNLDMILSLGYIPRQRACPLSLSFSISTRRRTGLRAHSR